MPASRVSRASSFTRNRARTTYAHRTRGREERSYQRALEQLDAREWDKAVESFDAVIARNEARVDASLYWKAYSLSKLGRRPDALASLEALRKDHAQSRWLPEARALEAEVRQASGQAPSPEGESDEELKLMALNALLNSDAERAVPMLEKVLTGTGSRKLKERALFVLAQSGSPRAREITARIARGPSNPDLQLKAIRNLGIFGGELRKAAIKGLGVMGSKKTGDAREPRRLADHALSALAVHAAPDAVAALIESARTSSNSHVRGQSLFWLSRRASEQAVGANARAIDEDPETDVKKKAVFALSQLPKDEGVPLLIRTAKDNRNPAVRKQAFFWLGQSKDPRALAFFETVLK